MAIVPEKDGKYLCLYCGSTYKDKKEAENCYVSHDIIYLPISAEDLQAIVTFIYTKEEKLLEGRQRAIKIMQQYLKEKARKISYR